MKFNKRGEESGGSLGLIVTIIIIAIVAIAVIYFFITRSSAGGVVIGNLQPSQLGAAQAACTAAASAGATTDFCATVRKIDAKTTDKKNVYVTCAYRQISDTIAFAPNCDSLYTDSNFDEDRTFCVQSISKP